MKRRILLILLCATAISILASGTLLSHENTKARLSTAVNIATHVHQKKPDPPGTIDGAKNPERITDNIAYSLLFRLISNHQTQTEKQRIQAYLGQAGFSSTDIDALITVANEFQQRVSTLDIQAKTIKDSNWPNPSSAVMAQLTLLQQKKEAVVVEIAASLRDRLTAAGWENVRRHINNRMKPRIKIHPGVAAQPGGPGWRIHNMNEM